MNRPPPLRYCRSLLAAALLALPAGASCRIVESATNTANAARDAARKADVFLKDYQAARKEHDYQRAAEILARAEAAQPEERQWYSLRAFALTQLKQYERALAETDQLEKLAQKQHDPSQWAEALGDRASVLRQSGDHAAALAALEKALKLDADNAGILNDLAWLRATSPDEKIRDGQLAVELAKKAVRLGDENPHSMLDTLAAAYAEAGDFARAAENQKSALESAPKEDMEPEAARLFEKEGAARLRLYEQRQPYREAAAPADPPKE